MFDIHIEEFYLDASKVFNQLYQSFPKKRAIFVEDISGEDTPDEYGVHSDRFQSCFGAMLWLADEGFIQFENTIRQEAVDQAILTSAGLHLLSSSCNAEYMNELLNSIHPRRLDLIGKPNIDAIRHIIKHGTSSQLALAMQYLLRKHKP